MHHPHQKDNTCYTSRGALAKTRNSSTGPPRWIDPTTHHTTEPRLAPPLSRPPLYWPCWRWRGPAAPPGSGRRWCSWAGRRPGWGSSPRSASGCRCACRWTPPHSGRCPSETRCRSGTTNEGMKEWMNEWMNECLTPPHSGRCPSGTRCRSGTTNEGRNEWMKEGRKEMFYLTTHSTHFIYGCVESDIW